MSIRHLDHLFQPRSVAVIGASQQPLRIGTRVLANLIEGGYQGAIWPLNPKYDKLNGLHCYNRVAALPGAPELAILCTPPSTIPGLIAELGARGTRAAIVMTAGLDEARVGARTARQAMLDAARPHLLRILGPGSVGMLSPRQKLNASFAHIDAVPGRLAFISQSGALGTAVLDWASLHGIGFSHFIAMGQAADVDFGDLLDYLGADDHTSAILLCLEQISCARKFMSAARQAASGKPVIVLKVGRDSAGDADAVFDAAIRRAGMLRVYSTEDLFDAVETLAHARSQRGERLAVMTNGGGLGLAATDALLAGSAQLAPLSEGTLRRLRRLGAPDANPLDLLADAPVERYAGALGALLAEEQADALLFLHAPTAMAPSERIAAAIIPLLKASDKNVLSCWLGGRSVAAARQLFAEAGLATFDTPEKAVHGFLQIAQYRRNQALLMEVPSQMPAEPARAAARAVVAVAMAGGNSVLNPRDSAAVLAAYGIAVAHSTAAADVEQAVVAAERIGYPVALKLAVERRLDVGGVALDLEDEAMLRAAAGAMRERLRRLRPELGTVAFVVQQMARRPEALELALEVQCDPVFGPVIVFGPGGMGGELAADRAIGLPPLNMVLARDMVERTRVARLLGGVGGRAPADVDAVCRTLVQLAELVADIPQLAELRINPLLADAGGVLAVDVHIRLAAPRAADSLAIRPYPIELEQQLPWQGGTLVLRPIRPEDAPQHLAFFRALDPDDVRLRFFTAMHDLPPAQLARLTQIDYDRAMAFIATRSGADGQPETLGVVRAVADSENLTAEFAVIVRSDLKGLGLGHLLFGKLVDYFRSRGTAELVGDALSENSGVQNLVRRFGGEVLPHPDAGTVKLRLPLQGGAVHLS